MAEKASKKYLSLREAAEMFGYSPDYIGQLIRSGKVEGKKIYSGISWQLTPQEIIEYCSYCSEEKGIRFIQDKENRLLKKDFLSLQEAGELSGYSSDYIGQLIREGKLKGKKFFTQTFWLVNGNDLENYSSAQGRRPVFDFIRKPYFVWGARAAFAALVIFSFASGWAPAKFLQSSLGAIFTGDTEIINFYSNFSTSTEGWINPQNVQGEPSVGPDGDFSSFSESNSAVYQTGPLSILVGDFEAGLSAEREREHEARLPQEAELQTEAWLPAGSQASCELGANRPCNSDVGACQIGVQVCDNGVWGDCLGAVMPSNEICDGVDNNCNGEIDDGENTCPSGPYQLESGEQETSFLRSIKNFFDFKVQAQNRDFSAKIKFSFAMGEKEPDISIEKPTTSDQQIEENGTSSDEEISFLGKIKNFFSDLFDRKTHLAEAQEANETTSDEIIGEIKNPAISEVPDEFRNDSNNSGLTSTPIIANQDSLSIENPAFLQDFKDSTLQGNQFATDTSIIANQDSLLIEADETLISTQNNAEENAEENISDNQRIDQRESASTSDILNQSDGNPISITSTSSDISGDFVGSLDARIVVFWSLNGEAWHELGTISKYPDSNAINGGYFEFDAPFLNNFDDVKNLKIKFEGTVGGETNIIAYLDSVWVEAEYTKQRETEHETEHETNTKDDEESELDEEEIEDELVKTAVSRSDTKHSCSAEPFSQTIKKGEQADYKISLNSSLPNAPYKLGLGDLPRGVSSIFNYTTGQSAPKEVILTLATRSDVQEGPFNAVIIYQEQQADGVFLPNVCQLNLIISE